MSPIQIGQLLHSSIQSFTFGCAIPKPEMPHFGAFVKVPIQNGTAHAIGTIYNIVLEDDDLVRQIVGNQDTPIEIIQDQRQRQMPIEVSVLTLGYMQGTKVRTGLPPQPPLTLSHIALCEHTEIAALTSDFNFLRLIFQASDAPTDELTVRVLEQAAQAHPNRAQYLRTAGQYLAQLMGNDFQRLDTILRRLESLL